MADEAPTNEAPAEAPAEDVQSDSDEQLGEGGKKALQEERRRAGEAEKRAKALQEQLDQLNDSSLSETQRLQKQIDDLTARYEAAQIASAKASVAIAEKVPEDLIPYLQGSTEDELRESARTLTAAVSAAAKPGTPAPDPSQGAHSSVPAGSPADRFADFVSERLNK